MIHFWWKEVFQLPQVRALQYYCRLDSDSFLLENIKDDFFVLMDENKYRYGYRVDMQEPQSVIRGLYDFVEDYMEQHPQSKSQALQNQYTIPSRQDRASASMPIFYNNFEIVHVPTFIESAEIQDFIDSVDESFNIYFDRWGDAPLRTVLCKLFLPNNQVHRFCHFGYFHQGYRAPSC